MYIIYLFLSTYLISPVHVPFQCEPGSITGQYPAGGGQ